MTFPWSGVRLLNRHVPAYKAERERCALLRDNLNYLEQDGRTKCRGHIKNCPLSTWQVVREPLESYFLGAEERADQYVAEMHRYQNSSEACEQNFKAARDLVMRKGKEKIATNDQVSRFLIFF